MAVFPSSVATDSDLFVAVNNLSTTLNGAIDNVTTTVVLTSAAGFPSAGYVTIENEAIKYTGISVNTLTGVTRGADGTTAASHVNGTSVFHFIVADHHNTLKEEVKAIESNLSTRIGLGSTDVKITAGNLGVGTASPGSKIEVNRTSGSTALLDLNANQSGSFLQFTNQNSANKQWHISPSSTDLVLSETGVADRVKFVAGGDVSFLTSDIDIANGEIRIGTTDKVAHPAKLNVEGLNQAISYGGGAAIAAFFSTSDTFGIDKGATIGLGGKNGGGASNSDPYSFGTISGRKENSSSGNYAGYLQFSTPDGASTITEKMRITSGGAVGIGNSSPGSIRLNVTAISGFDAGRFQVVTSDTGIVLTDGGANLNPAFVMSRNSIDTLKFTLTSSQAHIYGTGSSGLFLGGADGSEHVRINSSGQVGIGGTPDTLLKVTEASNTYIQRWASPSHSTFLYHDATFTEFGTEGAYGLKIDTDTTPRITISSTGLVDVVSQLKAKGTATNDNATAGYIGEYVESTISTATNYPTTGTWGDLTSISLTAGDWDVWVQTASTANGATVSEVSAGISTTSGNVNPGTSGDSRMSDIGPIGGGEKALNVSKRISLSSTTTTYLKYLASFIVATPQALGRICARRVR